MVRAVWPSFNEMINARDPEGLAGLMPEDHHLIDTAGSTELSSSPGRDLGRARRC
jgi:hypothetical protein